MENNLIIGCNYHTTWQSNPAMRFVLKAVDGNKATLMTRRTNKEFTCLTKDLIFVDTPYNRDKRLGILIEMKKLNDGRIRNEI